MKLTCINPIHIDDKYFPCGKCMPCRIKRVSEWQLRLCMELKSWKYASFVTLTYNNESLPKTVQGVPTLVKSDLQKFIKRLRKNLKRKIKYFACGEYGETNKRPHYHLIIYGVDALNKKDRQAIVDCWKFCDSQLFEWRKLHNAIDIANEANIRYVAGYVQKKLYGRNTEYVQKCILPPFQLQSQGLGFDVFPKIPKGLKNLVLCPLKELIDQFRDTFGRSSILKCLRISRS